MKEGKVTEPEAMTLGKSGELGAAGVEENPCKNIFHYKTIHFLLH